MASASAARRSQPDRQAGSAAALQPRGWVASAYLRSCATSDRRGLEMAAVTGAARAPDKRMENSRRVGTYDRVMFRHPCYLLDRRPSRLPRDSEAEQRRSPPPAVGKTRKRRPDCAVAAVGRSVLKEPRSVSASSLLEEMTRVGRRLQAALVIYVYNTVKR